MKRDRICQEQCRREIARVGGPLFRGPGPTSDLPYEPAHSCTSGSSHANEVPSHPDILEEIRFDHERGNLASFLDL